MALSVGRIVGDIELRDQFTAKLRDVVGEVQRGVPQIKKLQDQLDNIGGTSMKAGMALSAGITLPLVGIGAMALKSSVDFGTSMNKLQSVSTGTAEEVSANMVRMRAAAIEWGAKTQFSSTQAADALTELSKAGLETNTAIAALPSTLELATAGQMGLAEAAALSANTMATFGLSAGEMAAANDTLAKAANMSTIDVRDLAESLKYVGPVAKNTGTSLEMTSAAIAAMGEAGIKGSMAGTALRGMLTSLMTPTDKQAQLMDKLGMSTAFVDGKMKPLPEVLAMVEAQIKKTGNAGQVGADLMELFGDRAGPGMLALVNKGSSGLIDLEKKLHDAGYASRTAAAMMQGLPGALEKMRGAADTAITSIGDMLAPAALVLAGVLERLANFITGTLVPAFNAIPGPLKVYIGLIIAAVAAIGPLLLAFGGITMGLSAMLPLLKAAGILLVAQGAGATGAATGVGLLGGATVTLNSAMLITVARLTLIGGLISALIWAFPKAVEGAKNFSEALKSGDWSKMGAQDTSSALYWRNWMPGVERPGAQEGGTGIKPKGNIALPTDTFNIEGVAGDFAKGAGGLLGSLKQIDQELGKFRKDHPDKVRELTQAIQSSAFTTDQLKDSYGLSEMALKKFTDGVKKSEQATKEAQTQAKRLTEEQQRMVESLTGADKIKAATDQLKYIAAATAQGIPVAKMHRDVQDQINDTMEAAIGVFRARGEQVPREIALTHAATTNWKKYVDELQSGIKVVDGLGKEFENIGTKIPVLPIIGFVNGLKELPGETISLDRMTDVVERMEREWQANNNTVKAYGDALVAIGDLFGDTVAGDMVRGLGDLVFGWARAKEAAIAYMRGTAAERKMMLAQEAAAGIGGIAGATSQGGTASRAIRGGVSGAMSGMAMGSMIGAAGGPIGALGGAVIGGIAGVATGLFRGLFGESEQEKEAKQAAADMQKLRAEIMATSGGLTAMAARADIVGVNLRAAFNSKNPEALKRAVQELEQRTAALNSAMERYGIHWTELGEAAKNSRVQDMTRALLDDYKRLTDAGVAPTRAVQGMSGAINQLITDSIKAGTDIPAGMRPIIESLIQQGQLTEHNARLMLGLADTSMPALKDIEEAASRYGLTLDQLGPKVAQLQIDEQAKGIVDDFNLLIAAGADVGVVAEAMAGKVQGLVTNALKFGTELPDTMRPMIQKMVDMGLLTDVNGDKLKDLAGVKFAEPLSAAVDRLIAKLGEFIDSIGNPETGAVGALNRLGRTRVNPIRVGYYYEREGGDEGPGGVPAPTNATPGRAPVNQTVNVNMDGRTVAEVMFPHMPDVVDVNV